MRKGIGHEIGKKRVPDHTRTAPRGVKTPQDAPRPRSWSQLGPKRGPKIDPKSIKIRACEPPRPKTLPRPPQDSKMDPKMTPKSKKKRLILTPKICKKRPASRFVFQRFWVGKSEAQYQKRASIPFFFVRMQCNAMQYNTLQYNAMQCNAMQCNGIARR